ncbi:hypothetical protein ZWY2020_017703 [Hordeum vulgare]|nr:hypothetical protein ZWY2020_017703 [Hordeum vulgare]
MVAWTREIGLAEDVEKLKLEMKYVEMVLAASEGRRIDNKPLAQSLDDLRELLYDSEDVMDELDYYRLQQQIEEDGLVQFQYMISEVQGETDVGDTMQS